MTRKMFEALELLVGHGNGDVSLTDPTQILFGVPRINYRTAMALERLGYVLMFEHAEWGCWGGVELQAAGRTAYADHAESVATNQTQSSQEGQHGDD